MNNEMSYYHSNITSDEMGQFSDASDAAVFAGWLQAKLDALYPDVEIEITAREYEAGTTSTDGDRDDMRIETNRLFEEWLDEQASKAAAAMGRKGGAVKSEAKTAAVRKNGKLGGRPSGKLIAKWSDDIKVGIWDNEEWTLRLYEDRALLKYPTVKWSNNSGSLEHQTTRITGRIHAALIKLAAEQETDAEDYTERARELIWDEMH